MMSAKLAALGLLKTIIFWNKGYDTIIFVNGVTKKDFFVDMAMCPTFGNPREKLA